jgi:hypothetical protein
MEGWIWEEIQHFLYGLNNQRGEIIACPHRPNGLGLYDLSGNVWELGADWYDKDYYKGSPKNNPQGRAVENIAWFVAAPGTLIRRAGARRTGPGCLIVSGRRSQLSGGIFCPVAIF